MAMNQPDPDGLSSRLIHFTPLRYPGGKGRLAPFVKAIIEKNRLMDGEYVEPYAGGAAIAFELLLHEYVSHVHINDISRPVYAFWKSALDDTDRLSRLIRDTRLTMKVRDKQKNILTHQGDYDDLALGFAMFFLNRTNRSGILNAGVIGGRDQSGPWKMDARYNAAELARRIAARPQGARRFWRRLPHLHRRAQRIRQHQYRRIGGPLDLHVEPATIHVHPRHCASPPRGN